MGTPASERSLVALEQHVVVLQRVHGRQQVSCNVVRRSKASLTARVATANHAARRILGQPSSSKASLTARVTCRQTPLPTMRPAESLGS